MSKPHKYTKEEIRKLFLEQVWNYIDYWDKVANRDVTREKLSGLAHSMLVILDGGTGLPGFNVCPDPHKDDKEFHIQNGENYFPEGHEQVDIAGSLHELMYEFDPKRVK